MKLAQDAIWPQRSKASNRQVADLLVLQFLNRGAELLFLVREVALLLVLVVLANLKRPRVLQHVLLVHGQEQEGLKTDEDVVQL